MGESDVTSGAKYSGTLRCISGSGIVFELSKESFTLLVEESKSWSAVKIKSERNRERLAALHMCNSPPRDFENELKQQTKKPNNINRNDSNCFSAFRLSEDAQN